MEYSKEFRHLNRQYLQAKLEATEAASIALRELKPHKTRLENLQQQIYDFMNHQNYICVYEPSSKCYVCLITKTSMQGLDPQMRQDILNKLENLDKAKSQVWKDHKDMIRDAVNIIAEHRRQINTKIEILDKLPHEYKPPKLKARSYKVTYLEDRLQAYIRLFQTFVALSQYLKKKTTSVNKHKKTLKTKADTLEKQLEPFYKTKKCISVPVRIRRIFSSDFTDIVALTGSDVMTHKMDRHEKRNVEYYKVKSRNKQVKKFTHSNKVLEKNLFQLAEAWTHAGRQIRVHDLTKYMFDQIQAQITQKNEAKIKEAQENPKYAFRIVNKKRARETSSSSSKYQPQPNQPHQKQLKY